MGTLYLTDQNAYLRKTSKRLVVEKDGETLCEIPAFKVDRVVIFGHVQISTQAMNFLLQNGIETAFLTTHGQIHGRLVPAFNKNIFLRIRQYQAYGDADFRLKFARELVRSKLTNARRLLQRLSYSRDIEIEHALSEISRYAELATHADALDSLRGYEGKGTAAYFQGFGMLVQEFTFSGRNRRPPRDPVNSLLSFGYTLLSGEVFAAVSAHGLDPYLGFFHEIHYGRASLCFDLCEEFRHLVVDGFVLDLINHRRIQTGDFEEDKESGGLLLLAEPRKKFLAAFNQKMSGFRKKGGDEEISYRLSIHHQVDTLRQALEGKGEYQGYQYT
ncbi:MAG: CRISPR-associated endonuclease Cas1 [Candidatus Omnitrophota bacterium]|nr:MAG: CRISPR-associated endonuclease Cas1 [Candidatus Omnitrophota bacterium]